MRRKFKSKWRKMKINNTCRLDTVHMCGMGPDRVHCHVLYFFTLLWSRWENAHTQKPSTALKTRYRFWQKIGVQICFFRISVRLEPLILYLFIKICTVRISIKVIPLIPVGRSYELNSRTIKRKINKTGYIFFEFLFLSDTYCMWTSKH